MRAVEARQLTVGHLDNILDPILEHIYSSIEEKAKRGFSTLQPFYRYKCEKHLQIEALRHLKKQGFVLNCGKGFECGCMYDTISWDLEG
jgi:hypothetical protein